MKRIYGHLGSGIKEGVSVCLRVVRVHAIECCCAALLIVFLSTLPDLLLCSVFCHPCFSFLSSQFLFLILFNPSFLSFSFSPFYFPSPTQPLPLHPFPPKQPPFFPLCLLFGDLVSRLGIVICFFFI